MQKNCKNCKAQFEVTDADMKFYEKVSPEFAGKKYLIPPPTLCPDCRTQRRTIHRNEYHLYHISSALSEKPLISIYAPNPDLKIFSQEEWWSDKWSALDHGKDFNFERSFFEQFQELQKQIPRAAMMSMENENSDFTTGTAYCKNCYLINSSEYCEDCWYGKLLQKCKNAVDSAYAYDSEILYECFNVENCYNCKYVYNSKTVNDSWFCDNMKACNNCLLCSNLVNKNYHFLNEKLNKEEYETKLAEILSSPEELKKALDKFQEIRQNRIYKYTNIINCETCTGDFLANSKNCLDCYDVSDSEDCRYVQVGVKTKDLLDCSNMYIKPELSYEVLGTIGTYNIHFCLYVFHSNNMYYCDNCFSCKDCFGCVGLRNKQYCIFNKEYTEDEYNKLVSKIIEHMQATKEYGEFFPASLSPFAYNESVANDYFPLDKKTVISKGYRWREQEETYAYQGPKVEIPDSIEEVSDEIYDQILTCDQCGKHYKIIKQELKFYRKMGIPVPRNCPNCRHANRMALRNPRKLWDRKCDKCGKDIQTSYAPERPETVYCEECYLEEVY